MWHKKFAEQVGKMGDFEYVVPGAQSYTFLESPAVDPKMVGSMLLSPGLILYIFFFFFF